MTNSHMRRLIARLIATQERHAIKELNLKKKIGEEIRRRRKAAKLTNIELGDHVHERLGMTSAGATSTLSTLENGVGVVTEERVFLVLGGIAEL